MAQAVSRRERREVTQWVMLFRLLLLLIPSSAVRRAGAVVFAGIPDSDLGTASRKKTKAKQAPEMLVRKIRRELMLSQFLSANPGVPLFSFTGTSSQCGFTEAIGTGGSLARCRNRPTWLGE